MATTINGVVCQELREGFEEGIHEQGPVATKKYLCNWADRYAVANGLLGLVSNTGGAAGATTLTSPARYPESPNMFAREISIEGRGKATQGPLQIQFAQAVITVNYAVPQYNVLPHPESSLDPTAPYIYATQEIDFSREFVTVEKSSVTLANGHRLPDLPFSFPLVQAVMTIQLHRVPFLPAAQIIEAMKRPLNDAPFLGVDAGYLMFNGCKSHADASSDGTFTQSLTYVFAYRPVLRWDETFDPDGVSGPQQVLHNGAPILLRSDLSSLIPSSYRG